MWIALYCPPKQVDGLDHAVLFVREAVWERPQVKIIGGEVVRPTIGCAADLCGLQGRFNDASHIDRHLVLQLENIFKGAIETVSPQMRVSFSLDQLRRNAHLVTGFTHEPSRT